MDFAIIETLNGGDLVLKGNDLVVVDGIQNMPYLAMFGGNVEQSTKNKITEEQSFDWWGNNLLMPSNQSIQFNSITEKVINTTALTSSGRVTIENAIKDDLKFLSDFGAEVSVTVSITATDRIDVNIKITQPAGGSRIIIINFKKKSDGDFYIFDFNDDFYI
jgi:phage gp46-like protein